MDARRHPGPPGVRRPDDEQFAARFSSALARRTMSLTRLRRRLRDEGHQVALSTLSYWRAGERRPEGLTSLETVSTIEDLLELDRGHLLDALPPSRRTGLAPPTVPLSDLAGLEPTTSGELLTSYGFSTLDKDVATTSIHLTVDVDEERNDHCATTRLGLRAVSDEIATYPIGIAGLADGEVSGLVSVRGGEVVRTTHLADVGMQAWEIRLERPLRTNETSVLEHTLALPRTRHDHVEYYVEQPVRELMIWVRFTPGTVPRSAEVYDDSGGSETVSPLDIAGLTSLTVSMSPYGPGRAGIRWTW